MKGTTAIKQCRWDQIEVGDTIRCRPDRWYTVSELTHHEYNGKDKVTARCLGLQGLVTKDATDLVECQAITENEPKRKVP